MSVSKANPLGNHLEITDSSKCLKVPDKIGIIGLGLIGGTLAKTIHRIYPDLPLIACDTDSKALASALKEGVIRQGFPGIDESFANCRYIFLCAPVEKNETFLSALAPFLSERCILTDTGSVKASIHEDMRRRGLSSFFIGGHPMAGSEKSGYENATPYLFENAYYIITNDGAAPALVAEYRNFIASLGCIPLLMSPREHDYATAAVSHLPHILASSLVNLVKDLDDDQESMKTIAAGGFQHIGTRAHGKDGIALDGQRFHDVVFLVHGEDRAAHIHTNAALGGKQRSGGRSQQDGCGKGAFQESSADHGTPHFLLYCEKKDFFFPTTIRNILTEGKAFSDESCNYSFSHTDFPTFHTVTF